MLEPTPLYGGNAEFLDALYEQYLRDPASVEERWRTYFTQLAPAEAAGAERAHSPIRAEIAQRAARTAGSALRDRKSTRLNSSHTVISYAVFCLKKKKNKQNYLSIVTENLHASINWNT